MKAGMWPTCMLYSRVFALRYIASPPAFLSGSAHRLCVCGFITCRFGDLDDAWASFMATGNEQHVKVVTAALSLLNVRGDPMRLMVGGAAKWALESNA